MSTGFPMRSSSNTSALDTKNNELDVLGILRRRWHHLLIFSILGLCVALLYQYSTTPVYESRIEILVGQRSSELANSGTVSNSQASGDVIHEDLLATHMQLLLSRRNLSDAVERGNLASLPSIANVIKNGGSPVDYIIENIEVARGGEGTAENAMVLSANMRDTDPKSAAAILMAVYDSYKEYVQSHSRNTSEEAAKLIEAARLNNEIELEQADAEYREFIQNVPILLEGDKVRDIHKSRLDQLERQLNDVQASLAEARSRLDVIQEYSKQGKDGEISDLDSLALLSQKEVERLKLFLDVSRGGAQSEAFQAEQPIRAEAARAQYNRLLDLIQKERSLSDAFGAGHPLVEAVRKEIEITQSFMESNAPTESPTEAKKLDGRDMLSTFTMLLKNDVAEYEIRERLLDEASQEELRLAKEVENAFLEGNAKKAKLLRVQARYDEVIRRLQELNLAGSYAGFSTDLLATPEVASNPAWPKLPIVMFLGLMLGAFCGCVTGLAAEVLDTTFRDVEDLEKTLTAPAIAHVPRFNLRKMAIPKPDQTHLAPSLIAAHCPRSAEAEVYRVARTSLLIRLGDSNGKVVMMTSPHPGDGKSTTVANLAISLAQAGKKVLLIDSDLRRPVVAGLFGVDEHPGLADVLSGKLNFLQVIHKSDVENLDIIPHGMDTSEPAELLQSNRMDLLLQTARQAYDLVLIDAPPLLAVADPAIVAPRVDGVLITVRVCKNGRRPVERAGKILADLDILPTALIVNGVDKAAKTTYGYGNYSSDENSYIGKYHRQYAAKPASKTEAPKPSRRLPEAAI